MICSNDICILTLQLYTGILSIVLTISYHYRDGVAQWSMCLAGNSLRVSLNPTSACLWLLPCDAVLDAVSKPMVEYIDPTFDLTSIFQENL